MPNAISKPYITIRDLQSIDDLGQVEAVEKEVWGLSDLDTMPLTLTIAAHTAGSIWLGAFDGPKLVGFVFGFLGLDHGCLSVHSHMLAVLERYRSLDLGYKLKVAQRERVLALRANDTRILEMSWTFDPLQSCNAHLNFAKLGVISHIYKVDFYGPETSSILHRNGTDRLWVRWPLQSRRVDERLKGKRNRAEMMDALSTLLPLLRFDGTGRPLCTELAAALGRQRLAIEIPSDIGQVEKKDPGLARQWRLDTRWAFQQALRAGFFVAEFCRTLRGQQGPGAYLLERGTATDLIPEMLCGAGHTP